MALKRRTCCENESRKKAACCGGAERGRLMRGRVARASNQVGRVVFRRVLNGRLDLSLVDFLRRPPDEDEARGTLFHSGDLGSSTANGGVMEESGFSVGIFEWAALPEE